MYHNQDNNFFHGVMFHHFHDDSIHKIGQGSITSNQFEKIIKFIGRENIISAKNFIEKLSNNSLKNNEVCFTFDDGIRCQYDIALPILDKYDIKAFFFIYSSIFTNNPDLLEVYRYFRLNFFKNVNHFYDEFFSLVDKNLENFFMKNKKIIEEKKNKFPVYSYPDIKFRLVRDILLSKDDYKEIMEKLMKKKDFKKENYYEILFMNKKMIKHLYSKGHEIGLHSHSHPTLLEALNEKDQYFEYKENYSLFKKIIGDKYNAKSMSHPCGSYNDETLKILNSMNIKIGFKSIMKIEKNKNMKKINNTYLEIARDDHMNIINRMNKVL